MIRQKMGLMPCEEALARLLEFVDGELPPDEEAAVKKHLEICDRCYPRYNFQRAYVEFTRRLGNQEKAAPDLRRRLFVALLDQEMDHGEAST